MRKLLLFLLPAVGTFSAVYGDITLPPLISDNMMLQKSKAAVWGKADPGEKVTVKLGKISASTTAGKDGTWRVILKGLKAGGAGDMTVSGKNTLSVQNVAVGDVWVCSGQSNMEFPLRYASNAKEAMASADSPEIRMFTVARKSSETPVDQVEGKWEVCSPTSVSNWSAVGFFFARQLHDDVGIPIGMIHSSWGGTPAQAWTPVETLKADPDLKKYTDAWQVQLDRYPAAKAEYDNKTLPEWKAAVETAKAAGSPPPRPPSIPKGPGTGGSPSGLYNGMIFGLTPYSIKGAIWYQGESNVGDAVRYRKLFPAMIASWRSAWKGTDDTEEKTKGFPFIYVQIANFGARTEQAVDSRQAELRDAQRLSLAVPDTAMAVTLDLGDPLNIHPKLKQEVGRRLALAAEAKVYGKDIVYSGPAFSGAKFDAGTAVVSFQPGTAVGLTTKDGAPVKGFALAGEDKVFVWADAKIVGGDQVDHTGTLSPAKSGKKKSHKSAEPVPEPTIIVSSSAVPKPIAVRYGWADSPDLNLVNKAGLPASSFRTDDWFQNPPKTVLPPSPSPSPVTVTAASPSATPSTVSTPVPAPASK